MTTRFTLKIKFLAATLLFGVAGAEGSDNGQWFTSGGGPSAAFYSPLKQINTASVERLGLAWQYITNTYRGMEATPTESAGMLYVSGIWGMVYALDAATGKLLWIFDPHVDPQTSRWTGTDLSNKGVALSMGKVYALAADCRLFSLDARTGREFWSVDTLAEKGAEYTCPGAPQIAGASVVVGNAGGDWLGGGIRGYVSAFDLATGRLNWRTYTVPSLQDQHPTPELQIAAKTWDPKRDPSWGGGGAVWNLLTYDPETDLLYFGTGNPGPYTDERDASGARDRLYASSILALRAKTGHLAWHYQTTPADIWDFDAIANLTLADLRINGKDRRVIMQANKNGYFYVLDRLTGKPLSAVPFAYMNWSSGMGENFRPIVTAESDYTAAPKVIYPSVIGAHSWAPMSFSRSTGFAYIPVIENGNIMADARHLPRSHISDIEGALGVTEIFNDPLLSYEFWEPLLGETLPRFPEEPTQSKKPRIRGVLKAWDPIKGQVVWQQQTSQDYVLLDGGVLSTAGGLLFAGREDGHFVVYDAATGKILKDFDTGTAIMAAPMSYEVNGRQYISVLCGHGGTYFTFLGTAALKHVNEGRILTFALDGQSEVPKPASRPAEGPYLKPPPRSGSPELVDAGASLFVAHCSRCHTLGSPGIAPDLTRVGERIGSIDGFKAIVLKGALVAAGMPRLNDVLDEGDAQAVYSFLLDQEWKAFESQRATQ
jgi:quinohemoprotein ethanol dehydrogenase